MDHLTFKEVLFSSSAAAFKTPTGHFRSSESRDGGEQLAPHCNYRQIVFYSGKPTPITFPLTRRSQWGLKSFGHVRMLTMTPQQDQPTNVILWVTSRGCVNKLLSEYCIECDRCFSICPAVTWTVKIVNSV